MEILITILVTFLAGMGAGLGTGFAGMSAAAVITPMLVTFLGMDPYMAVGIALSSDILASAASAITYGKNKNLDIKNGLIMMICVLCFTVIGSYDNERENDRSFCGKTHNTIDSFRRVDRVYMRLHRRRRRNDDVINFNKRYGVRIKDCRRNKRFYYDIHRSDGRRFAFRDRRHSRYSDVGSLHCVHTYMGADRRGFCKQSTTKNA